MLVGGSRWGLSVFAMQANEMTEGLREKLPPTDSRLRADLRQLEHGNYDKVTAPFSPCPHTFLHGTIIICMAWLAKRQHACCSSCACLPWHNGRGKVQCSHVLALHDHFSPTAWLVW